MKRSILLLLGWINKISLNQNKITPSWSLSLRRSSISCFTPFYLPASSRLPLPHICMCVRLKPLHPTSSPVTVFHFLKTETVRFKCWIQHPPAVDFPSVLLFWAQLAERTQFHSLGTLCILESLWLGKCEFLFFKFLAFGLSLSCFFPISLFSVVFCHPPWPGYPLALSSLVYRNGLDLIPVWTVSLAYLDSEDLVSRRQFTFPHGQMYSCLLSPFHHWPSVTQARNLRVILFLSRCSTNHTPSSVLSLTSLFYCWCNWLCTGFTFFCPKHYKLKRSHSV